MYGYFFGRNKWPSSSWWQDSDSDSSSNPTEQATATKEDLENIQLFVLTRNLDDVSNCEQIQNWNKVEFKLLSKQIDEEDDEINVQSCLNRAVACHIKDFDETHGTKTVPGLASSPSQNISESQTSLPPVKQQVHLGIFCENESNIHVKVVFEINGLKQKHSANKTKKKKISYQGVMAVGFSNPEKAENDNGDPESVESYDMYDSHEKILEYEFRCRNKTGYLLELIKAGIDVGVTSTQQQQSTEGNISQPIEISDSNSTEDSAIINEPPKLPEYKSLSLMDKVKETAEQVEKKSVEEVIKFIKLIDEDLLYAIQKPFRENHIGGVAFLSLTSPDMRGLGLVIGHQIMIKQILQCIRENGN
ncbi:hypothetical protein ABK040_006504 [Willaertia magna]